MALLNVIKEKKDILFASFKNNNVTKKHKQEAWEEVLKKAQSLQLASSQKTWTFARDNLFGLWKSRTLAKRDNARRMGSSDGKYSVMNEVDLAILDIISSDAVVVEGLNLPESYTVSPTDDAPTVPTQNSHKRKSSTKFPNETMDREKKLRLELLQVEVYYRKLQCIELERKLQLPTSALTRDIATQETVTVTEISESIVLDDSNDI
ncbi:uncharacterized protein [Musca autumnalis]|uniref:uncharacterized protein n=1 Tax=Musca autumnalis TaxID=221902 RepID=UPI003CF9245A